MIDAGHEHLSGEYEEDGVVDLGSVQVVCHEGFRQPSPARQRWTLAFAGWAYT